MRKTKQNSIRPFYVARQDFLASLERYQFAAMSAITLLRALQRFDGLDPAWKKQIQQRLDEWDAATGMDGEQ